jgi:hypothetical protein
MAKQRQCFSGYPTLRTAEKKALARAVTSPAYNPTPPKPTLPLCKKLSLRS